MIKANELRIGNYLNIFKVETVGFNPVRIDEPRLFALINGQEQTYYPIPLTPEIFIHAGFSYKKMPFDGTMGFCKEGDQYFIGFANDKAGWNFHNPHFDLNIGFVHQLQNLYFALTGEELTISL